MDRIAKLQEFLAATPNDNFLQHALALEWVKLGEDSKARELFETILERDENYVGSYYHLAKLLERTGNRDAALSCYEKGMQKAQSLGDRHAYGELQSAYEELADW